jgi:hypothetical protein
MGMEAGRVDEARVLGVVMEAELVAHVRTLATTKTQRQRNSSSAQQGSFALHCFDSVPTGSGP